MTDKPEPNPVTPEPGPPRADHETVPLAQQPSPAAPTPPSAPTPAPAPAATPAEPPSVGPTAPGPPPGAWAPPPGWVPVGYAAAPAGAVPPTTAERRSWRSWPGWRRFLVPGLVGLILGGLLGSGITALATHDDGNHRVPVGRFGPGHDGFGPGYGFGPGSRGGDGFGNRGQYGTGPNGVGPNGTGPGGGGTQTVPTPQTPQPSPSG